MTLVAEKALTPQRLYTGTQIRSVRYGKGKPILFIHGLGGNWQSWGSVLYDVAREREVIAVNLPGSGDAPPLPGEMSVRTLADALTAFLQDNNLSGVDAVGSSLGARLVLELARRGGVVGSVVALNPGGFWRGWERYAFFASLWLSVRLVRGLQPAMPRLVESAAARTLLFAQLSACPWDLPPRLMRNEMRSYAVSASFDELLRRLAFGEEQQGAPRGSVTAPLVIGWGRRDRVCFPWQAKRAIEKFPDAQLHWFENCGHFPQWDKPAETARLILATVGTPARTAGQ